MLLGMWKGKLEVANFCGRGSVLYPFTVSGSTLTIQIELQKFECGAFLKNIRRKVNVR